MKIYTTTPVIVNAIKWDGTNESLEETKRLKGVSLALDGSHAGYLHYKKGKRVHRWRIKAGDYVVVHESGAVTVMTAPRFGEKYTLVAEGLNSG